MYTRSSRGKRHGQGGARVLRPHPACDSNPNLAVRMGGVVLVGVGVRRLAAKQLPLVALDLHDQHGVVGKDLCARRDRRLAREIRPQILRSPHRVYQHMTPAGWTPVGRGGAGSSHDSIDRRELCRRSAGVLLRHTRQRRPGRVKVADVGDAVQFLADHCRRRRLQHAAADKRIHADATLSKRYRCDVEKNATQVAATS